MCHILEQIEKLSDLTFIDCGNGEDELSACLASPDSPEDVFDGRALTDAVNRFLDTLPAETRVMFILRYWYCLPVSEIAAEVGGGASRVKMTLMRTRKKLRACLEQEGYL